MAEIAKGRRRWPWWILAVVVLLLFGGPFAWRFRPLNAAERRMLGTWVDAEFPDTRFTFRPDRTSTRPGCDPAPDVLGIWMCSQDRLFQQDDYEAPQTPMAILKRWVRVDRWGRGASTDWQTLRFEDDSHIWIDDVPFVRVVETASVP